MSARGYYGVHNGPRVGQAPAVYVERPRSSVPWFVAAVGFGAAFLWTRHQSKQIEKLSAASGIPYKSFAADLRDSARGLAARVTSRPTAKAEEV